MNYFNIFLMKQDFIYKYKTRKNKRYIDITFELS